MNFDFSDIIYRGRRVNTMEWVYGYLLVRNDRYYIATEDAMKYMYRMGVKSTLDLIEVEPATVGVSTLYTDKDDILVFTGDILEVLPGEADEEDDVPSVEGSPYSSNFPVLVFFNEEDSMIYATGFCAIDTCEFRFCRIIGNMFDNPELLETVDFSMHEDEEEDDYDEDEE